MWYLCVLYVILTCEWYGPKKGRGLVYLSRGQTYSTCLPSRCKSATVVPQAKPKTPSYIVDTCLFPEYIIVGLFSGLFFPFVVYLVLWIFDIFLGALVYILHCGQSFWHCK